MSSSPVRNPPDRIAVFRYDDDKNPCYQYNAEVVKTSLRVNPHIWKILKNLDSPNAISSRFVTCIQSIRLRLKRKPECLNSYGIIFDDIDDKIGFKNDYYYLF